MPAKRQSGTDHLENLRGLTADAVRQARVELSKQFGADKLFAFALCTDDDVSTLYHGSCTRKWVQKREPKYPGIGYIYVEWEQCASESLFDPVNKMVAALAREVYKTDRARANARDRRFDALVLGLQDCRNDGIFDEDTLLCCGDTDPSDHMESLAMNAVDKLNLPVVADRFAKYLGYSHHRKKRK